MYEYVTNGFKIQPCSKQNSYIYIYIYREREREENMQGGKGHKYNKSHCMVAKNQ